MNIQISVRFKFYCLLVLHISIFNVSVFAQQATKNIVQSDISLGSKPGVALRRPWKNMITVGRAYDIMRADLQEHLIRGQKQIGWKYIRFHAIFHDDMHVAERDPGSGKIVYNWHHTDKLIDFLLSIGLKPFVELNSMPQALASGSQTMFFYKMNISPPKHYHEWQALVAAFTGHCVERYGLEQVKSWYFEVWNEPNLSGFWSGTKQEYFQLYDASARGVKSVDKSLRIGGPASSKASWVTDMINHCHANNVPLDFVSTHLYPQDEQVSYPDLKGTPHKRGDYFKDMFAQVKREVASSKMPKLEIHWSEWNTQSAKTATQVTWGENIYVDNLFAAGFIVSNCLALDTLSESMGYWVLSDIFEEGGIPMAPFSSTYGLLTVQGIAKASYNAFEFLNQMRGGVLPISTSKTLPQGCGLVAVKELNTRKVLLYNHPPVEQTSQSAWQANISLDLPDSVSYQAIVSVIGVGQGSPWETWHLMGRPRNLTIAQQRLLENHSRPFMQMQPLTHKKSKYQTQILLLPGQVALLEIIPMQQPSFGKTVDAAQMAEWERQQSEKSRK